MQNVDFNLIVSDVAINKISSVLVNKPAKSFFRIDISSGGCAGFSTSFRIDNEIHEEDLIIEKNNIKIVINKQIAEFIKEAELKYNSDVLSSYFNLDVKTAKDKCSCGTSFSI